jgi:hypothetical protein
MRETLFFLAILFAGVVSAQSIQADKKELHDLLEERRQKFDAYSMSIEKRSGIFGNKTKGDIKKSNEVLQEIVGTDNKIIRSLNRVVDFRNYEKVSMNYDLRDRDQTLTNLQAAVDTLAKQTDTLTLSNEKLKAKLVARNFLMFFFMFLSFALLGKNILKWRKEKQRNEIFSDRSPGDIQV